MAKDKVEQELVKEPSMDDILSAKPEGTKDSQTGRWKGGRYDTLKKDEKVAWDNLKAMLRYHGDNNGEVKLRVDNLASAIQSGVLEIRKVKGGK